MAPFVRRGIPGSAHSNQLTPTSKSRRVRASYSHTLLTERVDRMKIWALLFTAPALAGAWVTPAKGLSSLHRTSSLRQSRDSPLFMSADEFTVAVLGDLHMDPRKMEDYEIGRDQIKPIFEEAKAKHGNVALVSLGDLGESKSVRPKETSELFAGTTECHELAAEYLSSFGVPYEVIGGNHDLEGLDEFATDQEVSCLDGVCLCAMLKSECVLTSCQRTIRLLVFVPAASLIALSCRIRPGLYLKS